MRVTQAVEPQDSALAPARLTSADANCVLEQLSQSGLIASGRVNVIALDRVRERLGDRWERKREVVWSHLEAAARRHLAPGDLCLRLDDTDYAIAISQSAPVAGQAQCLRILGEVLEHFLGVCRTEDMVIRSITSISGGEIACEALDPRAIQRAAVEPLHASPIGDGDRFHEQPITLAAMPGRELRLHHAFETLINLASHRAIATTLEPSLIDVASGRRFPACAFSRLSDGDLWSIDRATLELAQAARAHGYPPAPLILPLSFQSLSGSRGRAQLVQLLSVRDRALVIPCVRNLEAGTPPGVLAELVGILRQMDVGVFVRLSGSRDLPALSETRPNGIVLDAEPLSVRPDRLSEALRSFAQRAHGGAPVLAARGLPNDEAMVQAARAGFAHACTAGQDALTLAA